MAYFAPRRGASLIMQALRERCLVDRFTVVTTGASSDLSSSVTTRETSISLVQPHICCAYSRCIIFVHMFYTNVVSCFP